jgi:ribosomal protein L11 methylase PrmA
MLPWGTRLNFGLLTHIHVHAGAQTRFADAEIEQPKARGGVSKQAMIGLIDSLRVTVEKLTWKAGGTEWGNYYDITNYSNAAFAHKKDIISGWVERVSPTMVWDLGANSGEFSRLASEHGVFTVSSDIDPTAVEQNYRRVREKKETNLLPLVLDLTNPSPGLGWANQERDSFAQRGPADLAFALALVHHLAISNNVPLVRVAEYFASLCKWLVIEFVPKSDSQVRKLLKSREDIFDQYTQEGFEQALSTCFEIRETVQVKDSERTLYLLQICE